MSRTQEMLAKRGTQTEKMISGTRRDTGSRTQKLLENKGISTVEETNPRIKKSTRSSSQSTMTVRPRGISDKPFITGAPTLLTGANEGSSPAMGALNQTVNRMTGRTGVETLPSLPKLRTLPMVTSSGKTSSGGTSGGSTARSVSDIKYDVDTLEEEKARLVIRSCPSTRRSSVRRKKRSVSGSSGRKDTGTPQSAI